MSLVIAVWDKCLGIAVSEGRAVIKGSDGNYVPFKEDRTKITRLGDDLILGITGNDMYFNDELREIITTQARYHSFEQLSQVVIPQLMRDFCSEGPNGVFGVLLLGNDHGTIRCAAWSTEDEDPTVSDVTDVGDGDVGLVVLGLASETHQEAASAVKKYLGTTGRNYLNLDTCEALQQIIADLAQRHTEINDRTHVECVIAPSMAKGDCELEPLEHGAVTSRRDVFDIKYMMDRAVADAGANVTAAHALTVTAYPSSIFYPTSSLVAVPGFGWSMTSAGASDVYNISGSLCVCNNGGTNPILTMALVLDGNTASPLLTRSFNLYNIGSGSLFVPFFGSFSGFSSGAHSLQIYLSCGTTIQLLPNASGTYAICQRIF